MQLRNYLKITGQHPELGGRSQFQLTTLVEIEWQTCGIRLHSDLVTGRSSLHQSETVTHLRGLLTGQQGFSQQPDLTGCIFVSQPLEKMTDGPLQLRIQTAAGTHIE